MHFISFSALRELETLKYDPVQAKKQKVPPKSLKMHQNLPKYHMPTYKTTLALTTTVTSDPITLMKEKQQKKSAKKVKEIIIDYSEKYAKLQLEVDDIKEEVNELNEKLSILEDEAEENDILSDKNTAKRTKDVVMFQKKRRKPFDHITAADLTLLKLEAEQLAHDYLYQRKSLSNQSIHDLKNVNFDAKVALKPIIHKTERIENEIEDVKFQIEGIKLTTQYQEIAVQRQKIKGLRKRLEKEVDKHKKLKNQYNEIISGKCEVKLEEFKVDESPEIRVLKMHLQKCNLKLTDAHERYVELKKRQIEELQNANNKIDSINSIENVVTFQSKYLQYLALSNSDSNEDTSNTSLHIPPVWNDLSSLPGTENENDETNKNKSTIKDRNLKNYINETYRQISIKNLDRRMKEDDVKKVFEKFGQIKEVYVDGNGRALVLFKRPFMAFEAVSKMNNEIVNHFKIKVKISKKPEIRSDIVAINFQDDVVTSYGVQPLVDNNNAIDRLDQSGQNTSTSGIFKVHYSFLKDSSENVLNSSRKDDFNSKSKSNLLSRTTSTKNETIYENKNENQNDFLKEEEKIKNEDNINNTLFDNEVEEDNNENESILDEGLNSTMNIAQQLLEYHNKKVESGESQRSGRSSRSSRSSKSRKRKRVKKRRRSDGSDASSVSVTSVTSKLSHKKRHRNPPHKMLKPYQSMNSLNILNSFNSSEMSQSNETTEEVVPVLKSRKRKKWNNKGKGIPRSSSQMTPFDEFGEKLLDGFISKSGENESFEFEKTETNNEKCDDLEDDDQNVSHEQISQNNEKQASNKESENTNESEKERNNDDKFEKEHETSIHKSEKASDKESDKESEKSSDKESEKESETSKHESEKASDKESDKESEKESETSKHESEKASDKESDKESEKESEASKHESEKASDKESDKESEKSSDKESEKESETSKHESEKASDKESDKESEKESETSKHESEKASDKESDKESEKSSDKESEKESETSKHESEKASDKESDKESEKESEASKHESEKESNEKENSTDENVTKQSNKTEGSSEQIGNSNDNDVISTDIEKPPKVESDKQNSNLEIRFGDGNDDNDVHIIDHSTNRIRNINIENANESRATDTVSGSSCRSSSRLFTASSSTSRSRSSVRSRKHNVSSSSSRRILSASSQARTRFHVEQMKQRKQNESSSLKNSIFGHDDSNNGIKTEENAQNSSIPETNNQANDNANSNSQNNVNNVVTIDGDGNRNALSNGKIESSASFAPENSQIRDRPSVEATTAIYFDVNSSDDDENDESQVVIRTSTTSEKMNDESGALADNSDSSGF